MNRLLGFHVEITPRGLVGFAASLLNPLCMPVRYESAWRPLCFPCIEVPCSPDDFRMRLGVRETSPQGCLMRAACTTIKKMTGASRCHPVRTSHPGSLPMRIIEPPSRNPFRLLSAIQDIKECLYFFKKAVRTYACGGHP